MYVHDHVSFSSSWNEKCFRQNCTEYRNTRFVFNKFSFRRSYNLRDNVEKCGTAGQATDGSIVRRMRFDAGYLRPQTRTQNMYYRWIPKATNTHTQNM